MASWTACFRCNLKVNLFLQIDLLQVAQQRRLIKRLETMGAKRVFCEWQDGTEHMIQAALERTLNAVESQLAELKREMTEKDARHARHHGRWTWWYDDGWYTTKAAATAKEQSLIHI